MRGQPFSLGVVYLDDGIHTSLWGMNLACTGKKTVVGYTALLKVTVTLPDTSKEELWVKLGEGTPPIVLNLDSQPGKLTLGYPAPRQKANRKFSCIMVDGERVHCFTTANDAIRKG